MKQNKGIAFRKIQEVKAQNKPVITSVVLSASTERKVKSSMVELVGMGDKTSIVSFPEPFDKIAFSLAEQDGYSTIEIRQIEGEKVYVIEKNDLI